MIGNSLKHMPVSAPQGTGSNVRYFTNEHKVFPLTPVGSVNGKEEVRMGKLPLIAAVASAMWALPASAGDGGIPSKPEVTLAQLNLCVGPDCRDRDRVYRDRRYYDRYDNDSRYRHGYYRGEGCRDVTVRERRGDEVVVRHVRRCD